MYSCILCFNATTMCNILTMLPPDTASSSVALSSQHTSPTKAPPQMCLAQLASPPRVGNGSTTWQARAGKGSTAWQKGSTTWQARAGKGSTTWLVQCICCVRRSSLVARCVALLKISFLVSRCPPNRAPLCRGGHSRSGPLLSRAAGAH